MSKYLEYAKAALKGINNSNLIIEGWINEAKANAGDLDEETLAEILRRREICSQCPFNSINAKTSEEYKELFGENYKTKRNELHCAICLCPIKSKTASMHSECGMASDEKTANLELKWKAFNNKTE